MTVRLENLTSRPVTLVLNSGSVLHLPPGHTVEQEQVEIEDNLKIQKLRDALVIAVAEPEGAAAEHVEPEGGGEEIAKVAEPAAPPARATATRAHPRRRVQ